MKSGIAADLVVSQVKNTASWLWNEPAACNAGGPVDVLDRRRGKNADLALLLTAHWATVATFVPTDVDARIRHHVWTAMEEPDAIAAALDVLDDVASWDVRLVSARTDTSEEGLLSGHDGEWLAVRAGALGRALALGHDSVAARAAAAIDAELDREERIFASALAARDARRILSVATILAHNLGDLSRVVAEWPGKGSSLAEARERYVRLGHEGSARKGFAQAGVLNKAIMAHENHRFLPLRKARALRSGRELLLPIGPWFDAWGETVARSELLEAGDRAEVLAALLELHGRDDRQEGCLRAIAGLHRVLRGGIESLVPDLPARMRKDALRGKVRDALDVTAARFDARIAKRLEMALAR